MVRITEMISVETLILFKFIDDVFADTKKQQKQIHHVF